MSENRIFVTGAGGFIGGRIVEVLQSAGRGPVRAGVRRWASAPQIGRLPVEIVQCDIRDLASARRAIAGCSAVVHCAVGDRAATVEGTRNVLQVALDEKVERVVHVSTIDVYGGALGTVREDSPLVRTGAPYGDTKIEAEEVVAEFRAKGLPVTILRPTIVYGPGSASWTVEFAERLQGGQWMLAAKDTSGRCNLVYVDDVVQAVLRALALPKPSNEAYNVNGADDVTWHAYFQALNDAMGLPPMVPASRARSHLVAGVMAPVKKTAKWALKKFPGLVMGLYQRSAIAKRLMKGAESVIRQSPSAGEFRLYSLVSEYPTAKAEQDLGYQPAFSMSDGITLSVQWLAHAGYLRRRD